MGGSWAARAALLGALIGPAAATPPPASFSPLLGVWVIDRVASRLIGELIVIDPAPGGYRFDFGAVAFVLPEDGSFAPTVAGRSTSLKRTGPATWTRVHRIDGRDVDRSELRLSAGDRILTIATTTTGGGTQVETLDRVRPGRGLAGAWRSRQAGATVAPRLSFVAAPGGRIRWEGDAYVAEPDGPPAANAGPTAVAGDTLQVKRTGPLRYDWIERIERRPYRLGQITVSADARQLTETSWLAKFPGERQVAVYRRADGGPAR
jgi:hypothetical protein